MSVRNWTATLAVCAATFGVLATGVGLASASSGLGKSVQTEKGYIAIFDPHVHWAKPTTADGLTTYNGTGDGGHARYMLLLFGRALYEVEGTISAATEAQAEKLGEIQDALAYPYAGKVEVNWYESQVQLLQAGSFPKVTKVFGSVRVGLGFSESGNALVLSVTVEPTNVA